MMISNIFFGISGRKIIGKQYPERYYRMTGDENYPQRVTFIFGPHGTVWPKVCPWYDANPTLQWNEIFKKVASHKYKSTDSLFFRFPS